MGTRNIVVTKPTNPNKLLEDELKAMEEQENRLLYMCSDEYQKKASESIYQDLARLAKNGLL